MLKGVLRNFTKFFFNKVAGLMPATLLKKRLWHRCFPVNLEKFLKTLLLQNTSGRLLLLLVSQTNLKRVNFRGVNFSYLVILVYKYWSNDRRHYSLPTLALQTTQIKFLGNLKIKQTKRQIECLHRAKSIQI